MERRCLFWQKKYAFEILKAKRITLGVFENNPSAYFCYKAYGFSENKEDENFYCDILGEKWKCIEMYAEKEN